MIKILIRQLKIIKYLSVIKNVCFNLIKILPLVKINKSIFFSKIISGQHFVEFQTSIKTKKEYFEKKYSFNYDDWFSGNFNIWTKFLTPLKEIKYLEIGSFEGRSSVFIGELNNVNSITTVDTFGGSDEHKNIDDMCTTTIVDFNLVYKNCSQNLEKVNILTNLVKDTSDNFFLNNDKKFNVIYIDGSHFHENVKKDFINSMNCLEKNGILICDDFLWFYYKKIEDNPAGAILECYLKYEKDLEVLFINHQIIFRKIN